MIRKVLVANRGEIARRVFRTCRDLGITTVAVYSDVDTTEPHTKDADIAIHLPGDSATETYLNIPAILEAAEDSGADAIHPGYGFLSENAEFARAVEAAGLIWIGPTPESIEVMGSKLESKRLMDQAGVATLPSRDLTGLSEEEIVTAAEEIGYPVLVKASAGGGGKGMRIVSSPAALGDAVSGASREAEASFGDGTVFLEKYLSTPRHIEIQVLGDSDGNVVSLFERECSIQRRHQKIIEESPSPVITPALRDEMGESAVAAARAVDYLGAGTVEFLFQDGKFYFLEMNTRLQVEHPVTEMVTGIDLVDAQIAIASGRPIPNETVSATITGHAIEARVYAEDPGNDFLPVTGEIHAFEFPDHLDVRVDSGVEAGSRVSVHYDPMLAKVIAHAETRRGAARLLASALRDARIHSATTNRDLLIRVLESEEFLSGYIDTGFIDRHGIDELSRPLASEVDEAFAARAAALSDQVVAREEAGVLATLPSGWRNLHAKPQQRIYEGSHSTAHVSYQVTGDRLVFEGQDNARLITATADHVEFDRCGVHHTFDIARYGDRRFVDAPGFNTRLIARSRFPEDALDESEGSLHAPMPGKVVRVATEKGQRVEAGEILVVLEAMKMEHTITAPYAGTVTEVSFAPGDQVEADSVLVVVEPDKTDD